MRKNRTHKLTPTVVRAACCAASLLAARSTSAALTPINNWIGPSGTGGSGNWADATNWSQGVVPAITGEDAHDVYFNAVSNTTPVNETITMPSGATAGRLNFYNPNPGTTTLSSGSISLRSGLFIDSAAGPVNIAMTGAAALNLNGTSQSFINNSTNGVTIAAGASTPNSGQSITLTLDGSGFTLMTGNISNGATSTVAVRKTGTGTWQIEGNNSTFSGGITIDQGTYLGRGNNTAGAATGTLTLNGGTFAGVQSSRTFSMPVALIGADIGLSIDAAIPTGGNAPGTLTSFVGNITMSAGTHRLGIGGAGVVWQTGVASGAGASIDKYGLGNFTHLAAHTFDGGVRVFEGAYQPAGNSVVKPDGTGVLSGPFGTGTITIENGGTVRSNASNARTVQNNLVLQAGTITLGATATQTGGLTFNSTDGTNTLTTPSTVSLAGVVTANVFNTTTFTNNLVGTANLTKGGSGTLILAADNSSSYTGTLFVTGGKLTARHTSGFGSNGGASDYTEVSTGGVAAMNLVNGTFNEAFRIAGDGLADGSTGALSIENSSTVTIATPVTLTGNATIHSTSSGNATFTNNISALGDYTLTLQGGNNPVGNGTVSGSISLGAGGLTKLQGSIWVLDGALNYTGPTALNQAAAGRLLLRTNLTQSSSLSISAGTLELGAAGNRIIDTPSFTQTGGKVDLQDNKMLVRNGNVTALTAGIASGYNGGTWAGTTGIITSQTNAGPAVGLTSLGIATGAQARPGTQTFAGIDVADTDALIMYTYAGDATLDGQINGDDFMQIDAGFSAVSTGWYNGDFNYSGNIDADDYFIIDSNYGKQSLGQFPQAPPAGGVTAVPEPASLGMLLVAGAGLLRRRCRSS